MYFTSEITTERLVVSFLLMGLMQGINWLGLWSWLIVIIINFKSSAFLTLFGGSFILIIEIVAHLLFIYHLGLLNSIFNRRCILYLSSIAFNIYTSFTIISYVHILITPHYRVAFLLRKHFLMYRLLERCTLLTTQYVKCWIISSICSTCPCSATCISILISRWLILI